uniref:Uncharacterized protein n=1 Tax=Gouania willdenowi TaxID=441366 RepID=A0A8C5DPY2_GOUWI
ISRTVIEILSVPDLGGLPPSTAVTQKCSSCFSLSKDFSTRQDNILRLCPPDSIVNKKKKKGLQQIIK